MQFQPYPQPQPVPLQPHIIHSRPLTHIIPPQQILQGLISTQVNNCDCGAFRHEADCQCDCQCECQETGRLAGGSVESVQAAIQNLQQTLDMMNHQVVEVEGLLSQRDVLYHQLDHLRAQRQEIQDSLEIQEINIQKNVKVKSSKGLKQMNQRLRRRIGQVRQYIQKMDSQNLKIQQCMSITQSTYNPRINPTLMHNITSYTEYNGPKNPSWVQRISPRSHMNSYNHYSSSKFNKQYFDGFRKKLQMKQEEAWDRVRRQEEEIQCRNTRSLMNFHRGGGGYAGYGRVYGAGVYSNTGMRASGAGYMSPKYRAF